MVEMEKDIIDEVQKRQLIWFGYGNRMEEKGWTRKVIKWVPQEKCKGGRQRRDWRDDIKEGTGHKGHR
jgi:hypothetical protein